MALYLVGSGNHARANLLRVRNACQMLLLAAFCVLGVATAHAIGVHVSLPLGHVGTPYSGSISASGGVAPYHYFTTDNGSLPKGLVLNSTTGAVTGTPTAVGVSDFVVLVTDSQGKQNQVHAQISISNPTDSGISISVTPTSSSLLPGHTQQFTAALWGTTNTAVSWSATGGTVSSTGLFTAPNVTSNTSITVTATSAADPTRRASATVLVSTVASISVTLSPGTASLTAGKTQQFSATVFGTSNTAVTWSTTGGTVSSTGLFTAPNVTSTTTVSVTATSTADPTKKASASVTVTVPTISVSVSPGSATVATGATQQFAASVQGTSNTGVTWSASSGSVSSGGMFTAPNVTSSTGATVTATSVADSTKKASATVTVTAGASTLSITTSWIPSAQSGSAYSYPIWANGGTTPYQWNVAAGSLPQGFTLNSSGQLNGTTTQTGQFSFTVQVTDSGNNTASRSLTLSVSLPPPPTSSAVPGNENCGKSGGTDGPARLPNAYFCTDLAHTPAPGPTVNVAAGASLQNAVNSATCGTNITVQGGATFTLLYLPQKNCDSQHWIIIRPDPASEAALPPEGHRAVWCYAGVASLPGRPNENCPATPVNAMWKLAVNNPNGVKLVGSGYRIIGAEIYQAPGGTAYNLIQQDPGLTNFILDRSWVHGTSTAELARPIGFTGDDHFAAIDGAVTDIHCLGMLCTQSQGFGASSGLGVYKIYNEFIESGGEGVFFGGGTNQYGTPCDIEVRKNEFWRPWSWMPSDPSYAGIPWVVENFIETKNSCRTLVEGNHFDHVWGGYSQNGSGIVVTPKNQSAGGLNICPTCLVTDFVFRYNAGDSVSSSYAIANASSDAGGYAQAGNSYSFHDNLWTNIGYASCYRCGGYDMQLFTGLNAPVTDYLGNVSINHDTHIFAADFSRSMMAIGGPSPAVQPGISVTNSILPAGTFAVNTVTGSDCSAIGAAGGPMGRFDACWTGPYQFTGNIIPNGNGSIHQANSWPTGNLFPANQAGVGFNSLTNGDYQLSSGSVGHLAGTDGRDIGADIQQVMALAGSAQ
jgi:hypothetical protein